MGRRSSRAFVYLLTTHPLGSWATDTPSVGGYTSVLSRNTPRSPMATLGMSGRGKAQKHFGRISTGIFFTLLSTRLRLLLICFYLLFYLSLLVLLMPVGKEQKCFSSGNIWWSSPRQEPTKTCMLDSLIFSKRRNGTLPPSWLFYLLFLTLFKRYFIAVTHLYHYVRSSVVSLYIDGDLLQSESLIFPKWDTVSNPFVPPPIGVLNFDLFYRERYPAV